MKQDVYQKVTDKIIADLEKGELTWLKAFSEKCEMVFGQKTRQNKELKRACDSG